MRLNGFIFVLLAPLFATAQEAPSFKDVAAIFEANCSGCHAEGVKMGGLVLDSYETAMAGGSDGKVLVPGKSAESRLYLMITGKLSPLMPMTGKELAAGEIETIRRWIDSGAKPPTAEEAAAIRRSQQPKAPEIKPTAPIKPQIFSLAWQPDGKLIAVGGFKEVRLVDGATGRTVATLPGHVQEVRSVAFSHDGKWLAAAGGLPARRGEVKIWDVGQRTVIRTIQGHKDCIYAAAFSPDGKWLATTGYEKLIKIWDTSTGEEIRTLKDHIDAVFALAFTADGKRLLSGAADRTVKVWDPATGERLYTLGEPLDGINTIALDPTGRMVAAGGLDKTVRVWELGEKSGKLLHSLIAHEDAILKLAWSPDGKTIVSSAADRTVKVLRADDLTEIKTLTGQPDWAYGVEFSPDGRTLAVGRFDGSLSLYDSAQYRDTLELRRASR
jgi:WD40 repeat protein